MIHTAPQYIHLRDICDVNQGLQIPISKRHKEPGKNRYFYITVQFLKDENQNKYFIQNPPTSSICEEDDILVVRTGSTGKILTGIKGCFHNNFFRVNCDTTRMNKKFVYYCLTTEAKQREMLYRAGVTTIPDLNHFMFLDMKVPLLKKSQQIFATDTLELIDEKIELNNKINAELESMAKLIYDYWFVQFDFPITAEQAAAMGDPSLQGKPYKASGGPMTYNKNLKREIPEGWSNGTIGNFTLCTSGYAFKSSEWTQEGLPVVKIKNIQEDYSLNMSDCSYVSHETADKASKFRTNAGQLVIAMTGATIGKFAIVPDSNRPIYINQRVGLFQTNLANIGFTINSMRQQYFREQVISLSSGAAQPNISAEQINNIRCILPLEEQVTKFNELVTNFYKQLVTNQKQNQQLTELRDWLLPMLMNGQVTVK